MNPTVDTPSNNAPLLLSLVLRTLYKNRPLSATASYLNLPDATARDFHGVNGRHRRWKEVV